ncbi:uncharacterized protein LOC119399525 isoform X2 [Rhipicephalus sanguineus]|uniref:Uncharacterized protein n=1 Tax=Rhipicephalus sanguineus TaxID=34632 RepID=A0A9D4PKS7_RHISA|nr:uncharacterized protein LOC119399525 isoform X2 [Rhipicephalus sanguineus]KAH7944568.1 hypothetical protein HPB52_021385 [Rhipicephalus sanguineus]
MTLTEGSRKRPRPCNDESCEFMPISKKINNLRIRVNSHDTVDEDTSSSGGSCPDHAQLASMVANGIDNPHYGAINRLLYEAHMQRQQRLLGASHQRLPEHCPGPSQL